MDADHLIFGYRANEKNVEIVDFWVKKIWQIAGFSPKNGLEMQVKQGIPINIRPKNWRNTEAKIFSSRREFVLALSVALHRFHPTRYPAQNIDWFSTIEEKYVNKTNNML